MAIRVRHDGRMLCAAMTEPEAGDTYIDDTLHYQMSVEYRVIVSEPADLHAVSGQWWWRGSVPDGVEIASFYNEEPLVGP